MIEGIGGKRVKIPLCKITLKSQWKNGPIKVGVVDNLPMKGISLILGNEIETKECHPCKMAKISAKNEEGKMAKMNAKHGKKLAKMNAKNEEKKMARMNAKHGDKMAAEPPGRHKGHSRSQSEKVERKEVNLPHLNKQIKGPVVRERMKVQRIIGINSLILIEKIRERWEDPHKWLRRKNLKRATKSCYCPQKKGPHCGGRYIGPYVISKRIDKRTYRIDTHEGKRTQVCHANKLKRYVRQEGPRRKIKNSEMPNKSEEKVSQLSVSEREGLEKLIKKYPGLFL